MVGGTIRPMIFVDYLGPEARLGEVREVVTRRVAAAMRVPPEQVVVRRILTDATTDDVELWIELSSDEQLYRLGPRIAQEVSEALRGDAKSAAAKRGGSVLGGCGADVHGSSLGDPNL